MNCSSPKHADRLGEGETGFPHAPAHRDARRPHHRLVAAPGSHGYSKPLTPAGEGGREGEEKTPWPKNIYP